MRTFVLLICLTTPLAAQNLDPAKEAALGVKELTPLDKAADVCRAHISDKSTIDPKHPRPASEIVRSLKTLKGHKFEPDFDAKCSMLADKIDAQKAAEDAARKTQDLKLLDEAQ